MNTNFPKQSYNIQSVMYIVRRLIVLAVVVVTACIASSCSFSSLDKYFADLKQVGKIPDVEDMDVTEAEKLLNDKGFAMCISDMVFDKNAEKDIVRYQTPAGGNSVKNCKDTDDSGRPVVFVIVSGGNPPVTVPDVAGMKNKNAIKKLQKLGFEVETKEEYSDTVPEETVISQDVANVECAYGSSVVITVSKGKMESDSSKEHKMPDFTGIKYSEAAKKLNSMAMYAEKKTVPDGKPDDTVLKQSQKPGKLCPEGTTVVLTVSSNSIAIPNVVYNQESEAIKLIEGAGAKASVTYRKDEQVKKGSVISQSIYGKSVRGKIVDLVVSSGSGKNEKTDKKSVEYAESLIKKIGKVEYTDSCKSKIAKAEVAYAKLNSIEKRNVSNYSDLVSARKEYDFQKQEALQKAEDIQKKKISDKKAANDVIKLIDNIGALNSADDATKNKIEKSEEAYDKLTSSQKKLVSNYSTLTASRQKYNELKDEADREDKKAAEVVEAITDSLGPVALTDRYESDLKTAEGAYNNLTSNQKKFVYNYSTLVAARKEYDKLKNTKVSEPTEYIVIPEVVGRHVGTNMREVQSRLVSSYPELDGVPITYKFDKDSTYSDGVICDSEPAPGSIVTKKKGFTIWISQR